MRTNPAVIGSGARLACWHRRLLSGMVLAGAAALPLAASAEIYGWVDANGEVTYSNLPPPPGARVTDVIHDTPLSPQALAEAAQRSEVSALKDRLRLLELEMARSKREVVDYAAPPPAPPGVGCGPDGSVDCTASYDYSPYMTTGLLYGGYGGYGGLGGYGGYGNYGHHGHDHDHDGDHHHPGGSWHPPGRGAPAGPAHFAHTSGPSPGGAGAGMTR